MRTSFLILSCFCLIALSSGQWRPDPSCPYPSYEPVRFLYPGDCTKYWECFEGTKYVQKCPSGLEFNAPLQQCDTPSIAKCRKENKESTDEPSTESTEPTSTWSPDPLCPYPSETIVYFPYPGDCSKYYECWKGNKYIYKCPPGLWWHEEISECDYEENVNCGSNSTQTPSQPPITKITTSSPTPTPPVCPKDTDKIVYFSYEGDCSKYWECYAGHASVMKCPAGLLWNEAISECDYKENVDCGSNNDKPVTESYTVISTPKPPVCPKDTDKIVYFSYEGDCSKYWECYAGHATAMMCPAGLLWNEAISECDYKDNVNCGSNTVEPSSQPPATKTTTTSAPTPKPPVCPKDTDKIVYFNYEGDCSKYWECYAGHASVMKCPAGLLWNEAISECDYKENVDCGSNNDKPITEVFTVTSAPKPPICPKDTKEIVYFNYEGDCSKYWECYAGRATIMNCPAGLWWNEQISECDHKENVNCGSSTVKPSSKSPAITTTSAPTPKPPVCPTNTDKITYYNYYGDCSKYWECYAGHATIMKCPAGLWWNEQISECDYKENVNCYGSSTVQPSTKSPETPTTPSGLTPEPPVCPTDTDKITYYTYYGDCSKYWECYDGHAVAKQCPKGLWWNDIVDTCDYKPNVNCNDSSTVQPTTKVPTTTTTTAPTTTTIAPPPICPENEFDKIFFPYDSDCSKYWECSDGTPTLMQCPDDLWWNEATSRCDYHENVKCTM